MNVWVGGVSSSEDVLAMVDNYGLLCLDIAWNYFKLQDLTNLKEGGWRLQKVPFIIIAIKMC
jgi:hypothetical protein